MKTSVGVLSIGLLTLTGAVSARVSASEPASVPAADKSAAHAVCKEAVVSPVSGFAECVKPRGAPVAPPPKRPQASTAGGKAPTPQQSPAH